MSDTLSHEVTLTDIARDRVKALFQAQGQERKLPRWSHNRLRRHHHEAGANNRQSKCNRLLCLRQLVQLIFHGCPASK